MKVVTAVAAAAAIVGATLISGGTLTAALVGGGLSLLGSAASLLARPGRADPATRQASELAMQVGEVFRQVLFGRAATAGSLDYAFNFGGANETDWEVQMRSLADHECDALEGFYVGDGYYSFTGDGPVAGFNGQLEVYFMPGTASQTWPDIVTDNTDYTNDDNGAGVCKVVVAYKADVPEQANPVWTAGRPEFLWVLRGKKCYQASKDSTVTGGSGDHRWDDPTTWEWTQNAAECRYQFQRGIYALDRVDEPDQLLLGRGLSATEAPPERSIAAAVVCAEEVDLDAGGTEPRYTFNGLIDADEDFITVENYFAAAMAGVIVQADGGVEVEPGQAKAVAAEITDADLLSMAAVKYEDFRGEADREWINSVFPRYVSPPLKYKMHTAPPRRVQADLIADGGPRVASPALKHVTSGTQAQRVGEIMRRLGRLLATATIPLGPRFAHLEEGDWIGWKSDRHFDGARKVFRIESFDRDTRWHHTFTLREIAVSVFDWDETVDEQADTSAAPQQTPPNTGNAPGELDWTVEGTLVGGLPALVVTGQIVDDDYAQYIRFEYREDGDTNWSPAGDHGRNTQTKTITGVEPDTAYEVAVSYLRPNSITARRVIGPATTGDPEAP
ncbi:phage tail protein [Alteriqipengyuania sp.]|uniref:phage tail protein n=1 Tax=Alteriqipengyuania sp. TaxID=2800692 RepID=UPI003517E71B